MSLECRSYLVFGCVQGVGFRFNTQRTAKKFGLRGWVRNLSSGAVEVLACGPKAEMQDFEEWLKRGPVNAEVSMFKIKNWEDRPMESDFCIGPTGEAICWKAEEI